MATISTQKIVSLRNILSFSARWLIICRKRPQKAQNGYYIASVFADKICSTCKQRKITDRIHLLQDLIEDSKSVTNTSGSMTAS
jgi:hypothetical protein